MKSKIKFLDVEDVVTIHDIAIKRLGGKNGIHSIGLLESAINHPRMIEKFGTPDEHSIDNLATAYFYNIIKNHPFIDGNKRTGLLSALAFLSQNGFHVKEELFTEIYDDLYDLALATASSQVTREEIVIFFKNVIEKPIRNKRA